MDLLTPSTAAKILGLTAGAVKYHSKCGHLLSLKVDRGVGEPMRLFLREDVERFRQVRAERLAEKMSEEVPREA